MFQSIGKSVAQWTYLHISAFEQMAPDLRELVSAASNIAGIPEHGAFNVIKISHNRQNLTLLDYRRFFDEPFPILHRFWAVDLEKRKSLYRSYENSLNPPILHRKELLLAEKHPQKETFFALTRTAEQIGLFDDSNRIGFKRSWESLLVQRGYRLVGHEFLLIGNDESDTPSLAEVSELTSIARHRTALTRYGFSAPIQTLARFGFLDGSKTVFDYGCGRGDDIRGLRENGIEVAGWDPYYAPDEPQRRAHIVNLGFVINVIENLDERMDALRGAFALADELLVISAMLANQEASRGRPYGDGILTARNTFQRYYTQGELQAFIAEILDEEPLPVGPGIFYVFKDKDVEQRFMYGRLENRRNILRLSSLSRPEKPARHDKAEEKYQQHRDLLESLWEICLNLGREPDRSEIPADQTSERPLLPGEHQRQAAPDQPSLSLSAITANFGSLPAALRFIKSRKDDAEAVLEQARQSRIADLCVYFTQLQFERRKPYHHLESRLQKDVKAFFGEYREALELGRELLFAAGKPENIATACREAAERGIGWLEESESLTLPTELVVQMPPVLRTYIGCGLRLYGDASSADLIKIHIRSGKLTLMSFDDFTGLPLPRMTQRVKIKLRERDLDIFDYGDSYEPPYLFRKSRFINEEFPHYAEQLAFDEELEAAGLLDFSGYGPKPDEFNNRLAQTRWQIDGFRLVRSRSIPDLDTPCGRYFTYRQLIECGETQARTRLPNLPKEPDSYTALYDLAVNILDPVIDYFGTIKLTYGFCSPELAKQIPGRIAPELDQHAAHEVNRRGRLICSRLGAAVDFLVEDEDMKEVAHWIMENLPFDRLYFYGSDRPIHLSYSEIPNREAWELRSLCNGKIVPRSFKLAPNINSSHGPVAFELKLVS